VEFEYYTWADFDSDCEYIAKKIKKQKLKFKNIFGIPRGGLIMAVKLSHLLKIPITDYPEIDKTLIVDDIADTGTTLEVYKKHYFTATLFYHQQSTVVPNIWCNEKTENWIKYPWEKNDGSQT